MKITNQFTNRNAINNASNNSPSLPLRAPAQLPAGAVVGGGEAERHRRRRASVVEERAQILYGKLRLNSPNLEKRKTGSRGEREALLLVTTTTDM